MSVSISGNRQLQMINLLRSDVIAFVRAIRILNYQIRLEQNLRACGQTGRRDTYAAIYCMLFVRHNRRPVTLCYASRLR
jgi:hypothetical protein